MSVLSIATDTRSLDSLEADWIARYSLSGDDDVSTSELPIFYLTSTNARWFLAEGFGQIAGKDVFDWPKRTLDGRPHPSAFRHTVQKGPKERKVESVTRTYVSTSVAGEFCLFFSPRR